MYLLLLSLYLHPPTWTAPAPLPPLSDLQRFPDIATVDRQLAFFAARRAWLDAERKLYHDPAYQPYFEAAIGDLEKRSEPWALICGAYQGVKGDWTVGDVSYARIRLAELRQLLGDRDYEIGALPGVIDAQFWRRAD